MKKIAFMTAICFVMAGSQGFAAHVVPHDNQVEQSSDLFTLDTMRAVIYIGDETYIITKSDLDRPGIDGVFRSLKDRVMEALLASESKKYKMWPTKEAVEKHLQSVQQENNLTREQLYEIFKNAGYGPKEGADQFAKLSAISSLLDFRIRQRLIIPERDVKAYYDEHPVWEQAEYQLQVGRVSVQPDKSLSKFKKELVRFIKTGIGSLRIAWDEPVWLKDDEVGKDWDFVKTMQAGAVKVVREENNEMELVKVLPKKERRLKSFEERYAEISNILRRPKYEELLAEYKQSLLDSASVIYFDEDDTDQVEEHRS